MLIKFFYIICILIISFNLQLFAKDGDTRPPPPPPPPGVGGNNNVVDEDPFLDYSEFESDPEQDRDEQFFRHGRFFMLSFMGGHSSWTSNLGSLYSSAPLNTFGGKFTYFFDLQWALDLGFFTSSHSFVISDDENPVNDIGSVDVKLSRILGTIKYYFSTRSLSSGFAILNPYVGIGIGSYYRRQTFIDLSNKVVSDNAIGFSPAVGVEYPIRDKSIYITAEGRYNFVNFSDESDTSLEDAGIPTLDGDPWDIMTGITICW